MRFFPGATSLLKGATFINFWFLKNFLRIFNFLFLWLCIKESNYLLFKRGLRLFKGLCLLFFPNVPGAMFIQGGTFIPDSRVSELISWNIEHTIWCMREKSLFPYLGLKVKSLQIRYWLGMWSNFCQKSENSTSLVFKFELL